MKIFLIMFVSLISFCSWSKTLEGELQKLKPETGEDYIIVYQLELKSGGLTNTLNLYDNIELKGAPAFIVTPKEVTAGKEHFVFRDSFVGACKPECKYSFIPIDFVRIYNLKVAIAVKDYKDQVARVEHNKKSYYFKFYTNWSETYEWRSYKNKEDIKNILEKDSTYTVFINEVNKCIAKKELKCLEPFLDTSEIDLNKIELNAKKRAVYEDSELCLKFKSINKGGLTGLEDIPKVLLNKVKNIDLFWEKLSYIIDLQHNDFNMDLTISDFGNQIYPYFQKRLKNNSCDEWLDFSLSLSKIDDTWKIKDIGLFAFAD